MARFIFFLPIKPHEKFFVRVFRAFRGSYFFKNRLTCPCLSSSELYSPTVRQDAVLPVIILLTMIPDWYRH